MNELRPGERELVALGAAMGSNCVSCIEYWIPESRKAGLSDLQISAAIRLADKVRRVPARKILAAATAILDTSPAADAQPDDTDADCGCGDDTDAGGGEAAATDTSSEEPCCT